ncbi:hypothetical protein ACQR16_04490 [Bradyrhizobium oligotrophicum]|uniref:hypothetical protein n=1 Tax=Bradyrhizobium oligotrophicum TaxID=44255 RepID=UPI003EBA2731
MSQLRFSIESVIPIPWKLPAIQPPADALRPVTGTCEPSLAETTLQRGRLDEELKQVGCLSNRLDLRDAHGLSSATMIEVDRYSSPSR